ncbi:hypothetical protein ABPG72_021265 [Tetrahymena utriculariae]
MEYSNLYFAQQIYNQFQYSVFNYFFNLQIKAVSYKEEQIIEYSLSFSNYVAKNRQSIDNSLCCGRYQKNQCILCNLDKEIHGEAYGKRQTPNGALFKNLSLFCSKFVFQLKTCIFVLISNNKKQGIKY